MSAVIGSTGLSGESIFDKIDWNLLKVRGGIPLFSDMILEKQSKQSHYMSLVLRKPVFAVFGQVKYKPGCTATEDGLKLEISNLESRVIVLSM